MDRGGHDLSPFCTITYATHSHIYDHLLQHYQTFNLSAQQQMLNDDATQWQPTTNEVTALSAFILVQQIVKFLE